jgi:hypothetical protein
MNDALKQLESLLQNAAAGAQPFPANSRYHSVEILTLTAADGTSVAYLGRRVVPSPERFATLQHHTVVQQDRLDNISARYFGDPELWWRLADANGAVRPDEIVETPGRTVRITLAADIPAASDD